MPLFRTAAALLSWSSALATAQGGAEPCRSALLADAAAEECAAVSALQLSAGPGARGSGAARARAPDAPVDERLKSCVEQYADKLDAVSAGLGDGARSHPLTPPTHTSDRPIFIGQGMGGTATHGIKDGLELLGMTVWHLHLTDLPEKLATGRNYLGNYYHDLRPMAARIQKFDRLPEDQCHKALRDFDYTNTSILPQDVDVIMNSPFDHMFINLYLAYPQAKFLMTYRTAKAWMHDVYDIRGGGGPNHIPVDEPCKHRSSNYTEAQVGAAFDLHNDLVRCVVPQDRLFQIDLTSFKTQSAEVNELQKLAKFVDRPMPPLPVVQQRMQTLNAIAGMGGVPGEAVEQSVH